MSRDCCLPRVLHTHLQWFIASVTVVAVQESSLCTKPSLAPSSAPAYRLLRSLLVKRCHQQEVSSSASAGLWQESSL